MTIQQKTPKALEKRRNLRKSSKKKIQSELPQPLRMRVCASNCERKKVLENLTATVEQDGVHAHGTQRIARPPHFDVNDHVVKGKKEVAEAA
jgi:hypothetical protein